MSTLGDLLAEHTVLPGNAVDHLHAVVGEWQLLADLSFADYLMWVRRDDGSLVCVAQCRPNTAPTVLLRDAVGTVVAADRMPLIAAAFESGAIGLYAALAAGARCHRFAITSSKVPCRSHRARGRNQMSASVSHVPAALPREAALRVIGPIATTGSGRRDCGSRSV